MNDSFSSVRRLICVLLFFLSPFISFYLNKIWMVFFFKKKTLSVDEWKGTIIFSILFGAVFGVFLQSMNRMFFDGERTRLRSKKRKKDWFTHRKWMMMNLIAQLSISLIVAISSTVSTARLRLRMRLCVERMQHYWFIAHEPRIQQTNMYTSFSKANQTVWTKVKK